MDEDLPTNGDAYRERLRTAVEDDFAALVDRLYSGLLEELPDYETSTNHADDVRAAVTHSARLVVTAVFGGDPSTSDRSVWREIGAQRARGGLRRETMAMAPIVALRRGFDFVLGKSTTIAAPGALATAVLREVWNRLEGETASVATALLDGYDQQRSLDLSESTRPHAALVDRLLSGVWDDRNEIVERARRLGADITRPHGSLVLVSLGDPPADLARAAEELRRLVPEALAGACRTSPRPHVVLLVPTHESDTWARATPRARQVAEKHRLTVVVVEPLDPLGTLAARYRQLLRSLSAIDAVGSGLATMTAFTLAYHSLLNRASVDERLDVIRTVLGPIIDTPKAGELLNCLDALYETREGVAGAARALEIHVNTFNRRKRRVHDLTGLSLDVPADAHQLFTARIFLKLLAGGRGLAGPQDSV